MNRNLTVSIGAETTGLDAGAARAARTLDNLAQSALRSGNQMGNSIERAVNRSSSQLQRMGAVFTAATAQSRGFFSVLAQQAAGPVVSSLDKAQASLVKLQQQIQNTTFRGLAVPSDIMAQYEALSRRIGVARASTNIVAPVGAFTAVNQQLADTKAKMQDILAQGNTVPAALVTQFRSLEAQVASVNRGFDRTRPLIDRISSTGSQIAAVGRSLSIVSAAIALVGFNSFKSYAEIDSLQRGLTAVMHSAADAKNEFTNLRTVSALPGLGLQEAVGGSVRLQAVGFAAVTARKALLEFGNAVALTGGGKAQLSQITAQLSQMSSKGKVLSQDLRPVIEAAPAAATAIKNLFGTIDPEVISDKLAAAGKDSMYFINLLVGELSKLPRVTGGPKNALENLGDSVKIAQYNFVAAADKALNLTDKIDGLGNMITSAADGFAGMSAVSQQLALGAVGVTAAIGPLALGIGTVMNMAPTFVSGFSKMRTALALLITPVGILTSATLAIAGLTYAWVQFGQRADDSISKSKLLADVNTMVTSSIAAERTTLSSLLSIVRDETASKASREEAMRKINALSPEYLSNLSLETINTRQATDALNKYVGVLTLKAKIEALQKKAADARVAAAEAKARPISDYTDNIPDQVGAYLDRAFSDGKSNNVEQKGLEKQRAEINKNIKAAEFFEQEMKSAILQADKLGVKTGPPTPPIDFKNVGNQENALKVLKEHYKDLERQVGNYVAKHKEVPPALAAEFKKTGEQLKQAKASMKGMGGMGPDPKEAMTELELWRRVEEVAVQDIQKAGDKAKQKQYDNLNFVRAYIKELQDLTDPERAKYKNDGSKPIEQKFQKQTVEEQKFKVVASFVSDGNIERYTKYVNALDNRRIEIFKYGTLEYYEKQIEKIKEQIADFKLKNMEVPKETLNTLDDYINKVNKAKDAAGAADKKTKDKSEFDQAKDDIPDLFGWVKGGLDKMNASGEDGMMEKTTNLAKNFASTMQGVKQALVGGVVDAMAGFSEALFAGGDATEAGRKALEKTLKGVINMLADQAIQMGMALLLVGAPMLFSPVSFAEGLKNVAAGTALIAAGGAARALSSSIAFEHGGTVGGKTNALIGEGRGTSRYANPEWVSPVDVGSKLIAKNLMQMTGSQGLSGKIPDSSSNIRALSKQPETFIIELGPLQLRGADLYASGQRFERTRKVFGA